MTTTFADAVAAVGAARTFADLDGYGDDAYRRLARILHPDVAPADQGAAATAAFARLAELWARRHLASFTGDLADLSEVDGDLVKVPRSPADNDLMAAEAGALTRLWRDGDPTYRPYAPRLVESYLHEDRHGVRRTVNVLGFRPGLVSLRQVLDARPAGLDGRDAAWMLRRLLVALGWAHRAGMVHAAVYPEHVLIEPAEHGVVLVDWCYSVAIGGTVVAVPDRYRDQAPPEVLRKQPAGPATDIHLAAGLFDRLLGRAAPPALRRFLAGCRYDAPRMRPQDAWQLLSELDELLEDLYGPRTFRPFTL